MLDSVAPRRRLRQFCSGSIALIFLALARTFASLPSSMTALSPSLLACGPLRCKNRPQSSLPRPRLESFTNHLDSSQAPCVDAVPSLRSSTTALPLSLLDCLPLRREVLSQASLLRQEFDFLTTRLRISQAHCIDAVLLPVGELLEDRIEDQSHLLILLAM
jgi:hypothetical protein